MTTRFLVTGGSRSGKTALANRLVYDLVRGDGVERQFASGASLASAVRELAPDVAAASGRPVIVHGDRAFLLDERPGADEAELLAAACLAHGAVVVVDATIGFTDADAEAFVTAAELRVPNVIVAVNKMDRVGFDYEAFRAVRTEVARHAERFAALSVYVVPVSAWYGFNIARRGDAYDWMAEQSLLELLIAAAERQPAHRRAIS